MVDEDQGLNRKPGRLGSCVLDAINEATLGQLVGLKNRVGGTTVGIALGGRQRWKGGGVGSILIHNHTSQLAEGEKVKYGVPLKKHAIPHQRSHVMPIHSHQDTGPFSFPAYGMHTPDPRGKLFRDRNYLITAPLLLPFYFFDQLFDGFFRVNNLWQASSTTNEQYKNRKGK